jgi:uncharacterized protein with PQ loop repeat
MTRRIGLIFGDMGLIFGILAFGPILYKIIIEKNSDHTSYTWIILYFMSSLFLLLHGIWEKEISISRRSIIFLVIVLFITIMKISQDKGKNASIIV